MLPPINVIKCNEADYLLFSTNDAISNALYKSGQWEDYLLTISRHFLHGVDAPLLLDIGANLGAYSIPLAKNLQGSGGSVIAFEPQRIVYYQLCGNVVLNRLDNFFAYNKAVGDSDGEIEIPEINYANNHNIGAFSLQKDVRQLLDMEKYMKEARNKVSMVKLDTLELAKAPALIKLDVEGFEINVLKGGQKFLEQHRYPPILFEAWDLEWFKAGKQELLDFVRYLGYEISLTIKSEYVAQHPKNPVRVEFSPVENGVINMSRVR